MKIFSSIRLKRKVLLISLTVVIFICLTSLYFLNKKRYKILLIGLDGAGWNVMMPIIQEGKLPNIKSLMDNGCWGNLETIKGSMSEIIWTTIATGKSADAHGITDNLMKEPDTNEMIPPTSNLRRVKAIWNILSEHKKKVGIVGYKVSWPAEKVNGVTISDRADESSYFSWHYSEPPFTTLCSEQIFNDFKNEKNTLVTLDQGRWVLKKDMFMSNFAKYLLKNKEFDFFCLYLGGIDVLSHYYWRYMFPKSKDISAKDILKYKDVIKDYYILCDSVIGDLFRIIDEDTTIIIVSDHGFKTKVYKKDEYIFSNLDNLLEACGLKKLTYNSKTAILEDALKNMWVDKKKIEIIGNLSKQEFNAVRDSAKKILANIKVKETGQPLFKIPYDIESGFILEADRVYINKMSEYHILINGQKYKISDFATQDPSIGTHDYNDAIIIVSGKNIRRHQYLKYASIYNITPTVLYLSGLPLAVDMPGKVLISAIEGDFLNRNPLRYIDTYEEGKKLIPQRPIRSPIDEEKIKERMRSLGYIN